MPVDRSAQLLHLLTQAWQVLHVSFTALDFLIEDHAIEPFPAFDEFLGEIQMAAGNKAEATEMFLHHRFSLLNSLRDLDFLVPGQQRNLPHLLQIHAHRIIQNINLGGRSAFFFLFLLIDVFFAIPVPVNFGGLNDVDLQTAQTRENQIEFIGIGDSFR